MINTVVSAKNWQNVTQTDKVTSLLIYTVYAHMHEQNPFSTHTCKTSRCKSNQGNITAVDLSSL